MRPEWKGPKSKTQERIENTIGAVSIVGGLAGAGTMIGLEASGVVHMNESKDNQPIVQPAPEHRKGAQASSFIGSNGRTVNLAPRQEVLDSLPSNYGT